MWHVIHETSGHYLYSIKRGWVVTFTPQIGKSLCFYDGDIAYMVQSCIEEPTDLIFIDDWNQA